MVSIIRSLLRCAKNASHAKHFPTCYFFGFQRIPIKANQAHVSHPETPQIISIPHPWKSNMTIRYKLSNANLASGSQYMYKRAGKTGCQFEPPHHHQKSALWQNTDGFSWRTILRFKRVGSPGTWTKHLRRSEILSNREKQQCLEHTSQLSTVNTGDQIMLCCRDNPVLGGCSGAPLASAKYMPGVNPLLLPPV